MDFIYFLQLIQLNRHIFQHFGFILYLFPHLHKIDCQLPHDFLPVVGALIELIEFRDLSGADLFNHLNILLDGFLIFLKWVVVIFFQLLVTQVKLLTQIIDLEAEIDNHMAQVHVLELHTIIGLGRYSLYIYSFCDQILSRDVHIFHILVAVNPGI